MIEIASNGGLNTVQDLGRSGWRRIGVGVAGAMDRLALAAGNLLLGNEPAAAGLEIAILPFRARLHGATRIALTGADCDARLDGEPLRPWWSHAVEAGQRLELRPGTDGAWAYLAVAGGIDVAPVLGSRSTDLKNGFGGWQGRALRKGDRLPLGRIDASQERTRRAWGVHPPQVALGLPKPGPGEPLALRVLPAAEYARFLPAARERFWATDWQVSPQSNRQGLRLVGAPLDTAGLPELLSHGIVPGTIQVPAGGLPIVQTCEANTSGGYAKIGTVIEADQWRLAQARVGARLRFVPATAAEAVQALRRERDWLRHIEAGVAAVHGLGAAASARTDMEERWQGST